MSTTPSYMCFGCTEIAWNQRTMAYHLWACRTGRYGEADPPPMNWICQCDADAPDDPFTDPITDGVCWYDPLIPESADFLGVIITKVTGLRGSTYSREVLDGISGGSILQRPVVKGKQALFEVILLSTSCAGMDYGIEWMRRQIEQDNRCPKEGSNCSSCQGQLMTVRMHCPDEDDASRGLYSWSSVGAIDGFNVLEDDYPLGQARCCTMKRATFTMQTENPIAFGTLPVSTCTVDVADEDEAFDAIGNCLLMRDPEAPCCPFCFESNCDWCSTDPGCDCVPPFALDPEIIGDIAPCFTLPVCRRIAAIGLEEIPSGYEAAMRLTLFAGFDSANATFSKYGMRNVVIRVYENIAGIALPTDNATFDALVDRYIPCAEIGVSWMPSGSELVIDGLTGRSWLKCQGRCVDHSDRVFSISGNVFPLTTRCVPIIVTVEWDRLNVQDQESPTQIPSQFTLESFLQHHI